MSESTMVVKPSVPLKAAQNMFLHIADGNIEGAIYHAKATGDTQPIIDMAKATAATIEYNNLIEQGGGLVPADKDQEFIEVYLAGLRAIYATEAD